MKEERKKKKQYPAPGHDKRTKRIAPPGLCQRHEALYFFLFIETFVSYWGLCARLFSQHIRLCIPTIYTFYELRASIFKLFLSTFEKNRKNFCTYSSEFRSQRRDYFAWFRCAEHSSSFVGVYGQHFAAYLACVSQIRRHVLSCIPRTHFSMLKRVGNMRQPSSLEEQTTKNV